MDISYGPKSESIELWATSEALAKPAAVFTVTQYSLASRKKIQLHCPRLRNDQPRALHKRLPHRVFWTCARGFTPRRSDIRANLQKKITCLFFQIFFLFFFLNKVTIASRFLRVHAFVLEKARILEHGWITLWWFVIICFFLTLEGWTDFSHDA